MNKEQVLTEIFENDPMGILDGNYELKWYVVKCKHDNGVIRIRTMATSEEMAIMQVMKAERCPRSAIVSCELKGK